MNLITVLIIHISGQAIEVDSYPSRMACGQALPAVMASDLNHDGKAWAQCRATFAPSTSMRPRARPVEGL